MQTQSQLHITHSGAEFVTRLKLRKMILLGVSFVAHITCIARPFLQAKTYNGIDVKLFQRNVYTWDLQEPSVRNTVAYIFRISHGQFWYGLLSYTPQVLTLRNYYHRFLLFHDLLVRRMLLDAATKNGN